MSYYRIQHPNRPNILDPQNQTSTSWNNQGDDDRIRTGISVVYGREELATYIAQTGIQWDETWELIELAGTPSADEDEDAALGAELIIPTRIISTEPITDGFMDEIFAAFDTIAA